MSTPRLALALAALDRADTFATDARTLLAALSVTEGLDPVNYERALVARAKLASLLVEIGNAKEDVRAARAEAARIAQEGAGR